MLMQGNISGRKLTMERLVTTLSLWVNRSVVDRTNLAGHALIARCLLVNRRVQGTSLRVHSGFEDFVTL